ncbi:MAG: Na+/H+ antiporter NhaA [Bacteroidales bacterium]|nr:Na+/H+ antiporter NhaA [Bacteroidales bacterium]
MKDCDDHFGPDINNRPHRIYYAAAKAIKAHATGGNVLIVATILALIIANLPSVNQCYTDFWQQEVHLQIGDFNLFSHNGHPMTLLEFINDALMAIFFFSIGLEIKREVLVGELSSFRKALLPIIGACGGMIVPVIIFWFLSNGQDYSRGCAIPMATDIAFSLGVLTMLGCRVPIALKVFLTTLAVVDDIGGIVVIAVFYSSSIQLDLLCYAAGVLLALYLGGYFQIQTKMFYLSLGVVVWFLFLQSGIHPTIAGVLVAFCVPARPVYAPEGFVKKIREAISHFKTEDDHRLNEISMLCPEQLNQLKVIESAGDKVISPLQDLEDLLHPIVNYLIVPLFAFANAGIFLLDMEPAAMFEGVSLAIICGLFFGKFLGIFSFSWLTIRLGLAPKPAQSSWIALAAVSMLGGIGFTVSLFIANLSFPDASHVALLNQAKLGIVVGSIISGLVGYLWLRRVLPKTPRA